MIKDRLFQRSQDFSHFGVSFLCPSIAFQGFFCSSFEQTIFKASISSDTVSYLAQRFHAPGNTFPLNGKENWVFLPPNRKPRAHFSLDFWQKERASFFAIEGNSRALISVSRYEEFLSYFGEGLLN